MTEFDKYLHLVAGKQYPALKSNNPPEATWNDYDAHEYEAVPGNEYTCNSASFAGKPYNKVRLSQALIALGNARKFMHEQQARIENLEALIAEGLK
jgi:hypothetical protein